MNFLKCPYCGAVKVVKIQNEEGYSYAITQVNLSKNPPEFLPGSGMPVEITACLQCKQISIFAPHLPDNAD